MNLPQIEVIGPQAPQRFVELAHGDRGVASVRADFGHQEDRLPAIGDRPSHPAFAFSFVILPCVVEEVDAGVDRFVHDPYGLGVRFGFAEMIAAEADDRNQVGMPRKRAAADRFVSGG